MTNKIVNAAGAIIPHYSPVPSSAYVYDPYSSLRWPLPLPPLSSSFAIDEVHMADKLLG